MCTIIKNKTFDRGDMYEVEQNSIFREYPLCQPMTFVDTQFDECTFCDMDFVKIDFNKIKITNSKFIKCRFRICTNPIALETNTLIDCIVYGLDFEKLKEWYPVIPMACPKEGEFIAYKRLYGNRIATLRIPADAKRSSAFRKKCRADKAEVIRIESLTKPEMKCKTGRGFFHRDFKYKVGEYVYPKNGFDENRFQECAPGIHFFMTKQEAIDYRG